MCDNDSHAGHGLIVRQFRHNNECDALEELQLIDENRRYDFNFQQITHLPKEIKILPVNCHLYLRLACTANMIINIIMQGDSIELQCFYRTTSTTTVTLVNKRTLYCHAYYILHVVGRRKYT